MATATKKPRATRHVPRQAAVESESAAITFLVSEDNGGRHRWTLLGPDGVSLAHSTRYATHEEAEHAALVVRDGAAAAQFDGVEGPDVRVDLLARRDAALERDDSDAQRWLDEGGSFDSEAVTRWAPEH
jgi:uncharacterized protein YegP (UPF0339 family)